MSLGEFHRSRKDDTRHRKNYEARKHFGRLELVACVDYQLANSMLCADKFRDEDPDQSATDCKSKSTQNERY